MRLYLLIWQKAVFYVDKMSKNANSKEKHKTVFVYFLCFVGTFNKNIRDECDAFTVLL